MQGRVAEWLNRPEYIYQPQRFFRRILGKRIRKEGEEIVELPWLLPLEVDTSEAIGRIISHHGIFEMPVVEAIFRFVDPGDLVLDAGANIGYMAAVAAAAGAGKVISFEPHPVLFARLARNVSRWNKDPKFARRFDARQEAISHEKGTSPLFFPKSGFAENQGLATLETRLDCAAYGEVQVSTTTLDTVLMEVGGPVGVLKIDIEGHEFKAFQGASSALRDGMIRDIIYESFAGADSDASKLLSSFGYSIFALQSSVFGPVFLDGLKGGRRAVGDHNLVATLDPSRIRSRMSTRGYKCLSRAAKSGLLAEISARY